MALGFRQKGEDVLTLIAKKNYAKAIELLRTQMQGQKADSRLRMQLADVLVLAGKAREAVAILQPIADEYAREGFAAKAVAVLKKIQKIDPGRRDVGAQLASLIQEKQKAAVALPSSRDLPEIGMEEIGIEMPSAPPPPPMSPLAQPPPAVPSRTAEPALDFGAEPPPLDLEPLHLEPPAPTAAPRPASSSPPPAPKPPPVVDRDLFTEDDLELVDTADDAGEAIFVEPEAVEAEPLLEAEAANPMSDGAFADELMGLVDSVFGSSAAAAAAPPEDKAPAQIVVSPLFKDFSVDEMVAVIQGLNLLTFKRGDVIIRQGQPGDSMYTLTSGMVRAFVKDPATGKQHKVSDLKEGAFFGEVAMLTRQPRSATVAALTDCELLELDRPTLDSITKTHPHVLDVLREFAQQRTRKKS
jgi:hypothetical protein